MLLMPLGSVTLVRWSQKAYAASPTLVTLPSSVTLVSAWHSKKVLRPMSVTPLGTVRLVSPEQKAKAWGPRVVRLVGSVTPVRPLQP